MLKLVIIPLIILVVPYIILSLPMRDNLIPFEVTFDSMAPTYKRDEVVYYERVKSTDIKVGDLIIYDEDQFENNRIFHRVVELDEQGYITKGDGNLQKDDYVVKYADVVGKVKDSHIPYLGVYVKFINENNIILQVSLGMWVFFFLLNIIVFIQDKKADKKERLEALKKIEEEQKPKEVTTS